MLNNSLLRWSSHLFCSRKLPRQRRPLSPHEHLNQVTFSGGYGHVPKLSRLLVQHGYRQVLSAIIFIDNDLSLRLFKRLLVSFIHELVFFFFFFWPFASGGWFFRRFLGCFFRCRLFGRFQGCVFMILIACNALASLLVIRSLSVAFFRGGGGLGRIQLIYTGGTGT